MLGKEKGWTFVCLLKDYLANDTERMYVFGAAQVLRSMRTSVTTHRSFLFKDFYETVIENKRISSHRKGYAITPLAITLHAVDIPLVLIWVGKIGQYNARCTQVPSGEQWLFS